MRPWEIREQPGPWRRAHRDEGSGRGMECGNVGTPPPAAGRVVGLVPQGRSDDEAVTEKRPHRGLPTPATALAGPPVSKFPVFPADAGVPISSVCAAAELPSPVVVFWFSDLRACLPSPLRCPLRCGCLQALPTPYGRRCERVSYCSELSEAILVSVVQQSQVCPFCAPAQFSCALQQRERYCTDAVEEELNLVSKRVAPA